MLELISSIAKKLKTTFEFLTSFKYQGLIQNLGAAFSSRLAEVYSKIDYWVRQIFLSTANTDNLAEHGANLLLINEALKAKGSVIFTGVIGTTLEAGFKISDSVNEYLVLVDVEIIEKQYTGVVRVVGDYAYLNIDNIQPSGQAYIDGAEHYITSNQYELSFLANNLEEDDNVAITFQQSNEIKIEAIKVGVESNKPFNFELSTETTIAGIDTNCRVVSLSGGREIESDNSYRKRIIRFNSNPQNEFNNNHILFTLENKLPELKKIWIKDASYKTGLVHIFALNYNDGLSETEIEAIRDTIDIMRPAHFPIENLIILKPIVNKFYIDIRNLLPQNSEGLENEITKNIQSHFAGLNLFEYGFDIEKLRCTIYGSSFELLEVDSFDLDTIQLSVAENYYNQFSGVYFG